MDNKFDNESVMATLFGMILLLIAFLYLGENMKLPQIWLIQLCSLIVVVIAAIYGSVVGVMIPFTAYLILHMVLAGNPSVDSIVYLVILGLGTGHYKDKFMVGVGKFFGIRITDYIVVEGVLVMLVWICIYPLCMFYFQSEDIRVTIFQGLKYFGIALVNVICISIPLLLLLNTVYKKRQDEIDARNEYMGNIR
ncbi:MAG: hypothetical protein K6E98_06490 [Lachnospiraceae bacterium]|nr:hypothetical protein [Lachnospiraceae bacterium]